MTDKDKSKSVMMVAVEYPPCNSAGVQRTLKFSELLPQFGWKPIVLTSTPHAYESLDDDYTVPDGVVVKRALGLDSLRHFRFRGKYLGVTAMPDRYCAWLIPGVLKGLYIALRHKPKVIYSTFPYSTAHAIAWVVSRLTGIPWVADFRDPAHHHYLPPHHSNPLARWFDERTARSADKLIFATEKMRRFYIKRYDTVSEENSAAIENGYNEELISSLGNVSREDDDFVILHSGALIIERDPSVLIKALGELSREHPGRPDIQRIKIHLRGATITDEYADLIERMDLRGRVCFLPSVSYQESVKEMMSADALLLMQGKSFNFQIPGKAYEYIAMKKPVIVLTDSDGATAELMQGLNRCCVAGLESIEEAKAGLLRLISIQSEEVDISPFGRSHRTSQLAEIFKELDSES